MAYQCRQCNRVGSEVGACPVCNIPMDIKLQDATQPVMPVVPAEEVTPVAPMPPMPEVAPPMAPMPEVAPGAPVKGTPAEGGDPTMA